MPDILLINPHRLIPKGLSVTQVSSPPLGLAYIAAICETEGFAVEVFDAIAEAPDTYYAFENNSDMVVHGAEFNQFFDRYAGRRFDMIGLTVMFSNNWLVNRKFINEIKRRFPHSLIIAGGEHVTALPEFCLDDCDGLDLIVTGEGENTMREICENIKNNIPLDGMDGIYYKDRMRQEIIFNNRRKREYEIGIFPMPAWHVFPLQKYFDTNASYGVTTERSLPIFATRGCPYSCTFCSSPQMWGTKYLLRDHMDVIAEIRFLQKNYKVVNFDFYDLTAIIKKEWMLNFCNEILASGLQITFQMPAGTRAEAIDEEVASLLYKSGCKYITYAPESGSVRMLKIIKKKVNLDKMLKSISYSQKAGMSVKLNMIMGFPDERISDILATWKFLIKCSYYGVEDTAPAFFSPYPGSELFNQLFKENEIQLNDDYFASLVESESTRGFRSYNKHIHKKVLVVIGVLNYLIFYTSNFLFNPLRLLKLIRALVTGRFYSRGTYVLLNILRRQKLMQGK